LLIPLGRGQGFFNIQGFNIQGEAPNKDGEFKKKWGKFIGKRTIRWKQAVKKSLFAAKHETTAPLTKPGVYLVEAEVGGTKERSRTLVIVTGVGLIIHKLPGATLAWVVDAKTGRPLRNQTVQVFRPKLGDGGEMKWLGKTGQTDANGIYRLKKSKDLQFLLIEDAKRGLAFSVDASGTIAGYFGSDTGGIYKDRVSWMVTDRPLYRPGDTVHFRAWYRHLDRRTYRIPKAGTKVQVVVRDAQSERYKTLELQTDRFGSVSGSFALNAETSLGEYSISIVEDEDGELQYAGFFRVEEYKKPEFEVTVSPVGKRHRLGKPLKARIRARYYFGRPVTGGTVTYKVYRRPWLPKIAGPHRFDWLYGNGFGLPGHPLAWLYASSRSSMRDFSDDDDDPLASFYDSFGYSGQQVAAGTAMLDRHGVAEIQIDTKSDDGAQAAKQFPNFNGGFSYVITAEVRDDSRRTVKGSGKVLVLQKQFHAHVEPDRNWYRPGQTATVKIGTRTANGDPVASTGEVLLYRLTPAAGKKALQADGTIKEVETPLGNWPVKTDAKGTLTHRVVLGKPGRYRLVYRTRDAWKQEVRGSVDLWVHGPNWNAAKTAVPDLQLIPERRTYRIGETARVLVVTRHAQAHILLSNSLTAKYRFVDVDRHAGIIEVPIVSRHVPNLILHAAFVRNGRMHSVAVELFVPPVRRLLKVTLTPDRKSYKPGQKGRVQVQVTDSQGRPVSGDLTLTGYDKALTYIQ
ncbi:MAG: hypothetical protein IID45_14875, partial [Planctomycetes bacterium]|nr:hypothetical protein [Planctomycetota bacterium]